MKIDHPHSHHIPALQALWQEAFGDPPAYIRDFFATGFSPRRCLCVTRQDRVIAAAYWLDCRYDNHKAASIYAVATAKSQQGQGHCHGLLAAIHAHLAALGYAGTILVPGEPGLRAFYRGMGYADFGGMDSIFAVAGDPISLRQIDPEEFVALRRTYLPAGGVVQEGENLAFLACHYRFYQGDSCLFAAHAQDGTLFVPELLGQAAPAGILAALDAREGTFRIPGTAPFAMWHPLRDAPPPTYFGFAFD